MKVVLFFFCLLPLAFAMPKFQSMTGPKLFVLAENSMNTMSIGMGYNQNHGINNVRITVRDQKITVRDGSRTFTTDANGKDVILLIGDNYHVLGNKIYFDGVAERELTPEEQKKVEDFKKDCDQKMKEWQAKFNEMMEEWREKFNEWMQNKGYESGLPTPSVQHIPNPQFAPPPEFSP